MLAFTTIQLDFKNNIQILHTAFLAFKYLTAVFAIK